MDDESRTCWVCYNNEADTPQMTWIKPCHCRGATKWVHQHCLQRWVDEKQLGDSQMLVACRVCTVQYRIKYPSPGIILRILELTDSVINILCPFACGFFFLTSFVWCCSTYGALTIMQFIGHEESIKGMQDMDPTVLLFSLAVIPPIIFLIKMVNWDSVLLLLWQRYSFRIPYLNKFLGNSDIPEWRHNYNMQFPLIPSRSIPRMVTVTIFTPTIATMVGSFVFPKVYPRWQRNILGSLVYILGEGFLNIIYQQMKYLRNCRRVILDYDDTTQS